MVDPPEEREASVKARGGKHVKMPPASRSQKPIYVRPIQGNVRYLVGGTQVSTKCRFRGLGDSQQRTPRETYSGGKTKILPMKPFIVSKLAHFLLYLLGCQYSKSMFLEFVGENSAQSQSLLPRKYTANDFETMLSIVGSSWQRSSCSLWRSQQAGR